MKTYSEKLRDPRWQKLRLEIMGRDQFRCRLCHSKEKTLNVHHSYYSKGANPWDYPNDSLVTVCEPCHKLMEYRRELILKATVDPYLQIKVMKFCHAAGRDPFPFPKAAGVLVMSVIDFLESCEYGDESTMDEFLPPINAAAMCVNAAMVSMIRERTDDARRAIRESRSLDELISDAPESPEGEEESE